MACSMMRSVAILVVMVSVGLADEIAWGDVDADGTLTTRSLDVPVAHARGAENFYVENPMDSYDWTHTSVVQNSLLSEVVKAKHVKAGLHSFEDELKPIFAAMPKDAEGRLNNGTARYALHRLFTEKHGWAIKGLQPAGAAWVATMSVTPDVKDITKYMVPTYLQDQLLGARGEEGFDLKSLALLATTIQHLINAELKSIVYSTITTHGLPIQGRRSEQEVDEILDTFMMVYAFGLNLDTSMLEDVKKAKAHLASSHAGWPQLHAFAQDVKKRSFARNELDFEEIVEVIRQIGQGYVKWQGRDCTRVKDELMAKPSYANGRVLLSEMTPSSFSGQRTLFTESHADLKKLGVLFEPLDSAAEVIISNYINSQTMCLSTASFYTACCINECEGILAKLERHIGIGSPLVDPSQLMRSLHAVFHIPDQGLLAELLGLADKNSGLIQLHGRGLASWMHRAFPLECPAPHDQKVTNPKTPDEWMERDDTVADLEEMMAEISEVLVRYTTMGKKDGEVFVASDDISDFNTDVIRIHLQAAENTFTGGNSHFSLWHLFGMAFRFAAMASMMGLVVLFIKSGLVATGAKKEKEKGSLIKDFV